jgi:hypothetical protein
MAVSETETLCEFFFEISAQKNFVGLISFNLFPIISVRSDGILALSWTPAIRVPFSSSLPNGVVA